jgi:Tfp pilus assembly protein PilX
MTGHSWQSGIALPAALALMLVLTLIAAGSLAIARLDLVTARSLREHRQAFELAEAGIAAALAALPSQAAAAPPCAAGPGLAVAIPPGGADGTRAWLCFSGNTPALAGKSSLGQLMLWHFEILAEGRRGNAHSVHRQGAWLAAPAGHHPP